MGRGKPYIPNIEWMVQAGINPATGLPYKVGANNSELKANIKKTLRIIDEQDAVNRYVWYNLPCNITSQELERMLYYKGQLVFFYYKELDQFYFMPYALNGTIDFYGRYNFVNPVPYSNGVEQEKSEQYKALSGLLSTIKLKCLYGVVLDENELDENINYGVLIHDYSKQMSQTIIPRSSLNDPILDTMSECIPYMRTSLILGTGIKGVRVSDADQYAQVKDGARGIENAALNSEPWVPIVGAVEFQELTDGAVAKSEEYMLAMQSLDNYRLSTYGIDNGGLFEKKAHELQSEADINGGPVGLVLQDGLSIRQNFCNIVNSLFDLGIWCEPAQNIMGMDTDGDGAIYDDNMDASQSGVEGGEDNGTSNV